MTSEPTHLAQGLAAVAIDANDPASLAHWWARLLGDDAVVAVDDDGDARLWWADGPPLDFLRVPEPKSTKDRIHLDLVTTDFDAAVERAEALGAQRADDVYDGDRWRVFRDPEGNEFCLLRPGGNEWIARPPP